MSDSINTIALKWKDKMVQIAREMIQRPSPSGSEKGMAEYSKELFEKMGFDESFIDEVGNVVGIIKGEDSKTPLMFNCHLDQVDEGQLENWEFPPFDAKVVEDVIYGRGASDTKGTFAVQVCAAKAIKELIPNLKHDLIVSGVVYEEPAAMYGAKYLCDITLKNRGVVPFCVLLGEATNLDIFIGHRGRVEIEVTVYGRTSHSSTPWLGNNAIYEMQDFIENLKLLEETLPSNSMVGKSSIAVTNIYCEPGRNSIVPDKCVIYIDRRFIPEETIEQVLDELEQIIIGIKKRKPDFKADVKIRELNHICFTGHKKMAPLLKKPFLLEKDNEYVIKTIEALKEVGQDPDFGIWSFGTDASHMSGELGIPTIGYSPAEEKYTHTVKDQVSISKMVKSLEGYIAIGKKFLA